MKNKKIALAGALSLALLGGYAVWGVGADTGKTGGVQADRGQAVTSVMAEESADAEEKQAEAAQEAEKEIFAMDTYMTVRASGGHAQQAVDQAEAEILRLDALLSTGNEDSEIFRLNSGGTELLSEDGSYLVERALEIYKETGGAFNPAIYPVMEVWGFPSKDGHVPSDEALSEALERIDASEILYDSASHRVTFGKRDMKIDLGGIAKGYTSSKIMEIYRACGVESGLVNLGGNVQAFGTKANGDKWKVAVQNPDDTQDYLGILSVADKAVITSGGYERYFEENGIAYHHIIDPATGYPAENGLTSVTVVSEDGTLADGLSTALFVMGKDQAETFWKERRDRFDMILLSDEGILYVTEGIASDFDSEMDTVVLR